MNKTSISSVVCLDIIDFSQKSQTDQARIKQQFHQLVDRAVVDISEQDRRVIETDSGVLIHCSGQLESALEDALFIALTVRDGALQANADSDNPLYLLIGIHLGAVDSNPEATPSLVGEGVTEAQRIMSFANPNQILVSASYYDMASKLTLEIAQMFEKYDMHAYEHDIYAVRRLNENAADETTRQIPITLEPLGELGDGAAASTFNWRAYVLPGLLALIMFFILIKAFQYDDSENIPSQLSIENEVGTESAVLENTEKLTTDESSQASVEEANQVTSIQQEIVEEQLKAAQKENAVKASPKKVVKKKVVPKKATSASKPAVKADKPPSKKSVVKQTSKRESSTWETVKESVKTGATYQCSQAEIAMNQCRQ